MKLRLHFGLTLVLLAAGCQTTSSPKAEFADQPPPPESWVGASGGDTTVRADVASWVEAFRSEELIDLVERALTNNPNLEIAATRLQVSLAEARSERGRRLPSLRAEVGGSRQKINTFGPSTFGGARFDNYTADLVLNWEVDLWGRLAAGSRAALGQAAATAADYAGARLSLAVEVARSWLDLKTSLAAVALIGEREASLALNRDLVAERFAEGLADGRALAFLDAELSGLLAEAERTKAGAHNAQRRLERLLGEYPAGRIVSSATLPEIPPRPPAGVPSELLQRRPDIVAAALRYEASSASLEAAERARWPILSLTASGGTASQALRDLLDGDFTVWRLAGTLVQPIFEGGRIRAGMDRAEALAAIEFSQYRATVLDAFAEVEEALSAGGFLNAEIAAVERAVEAAGDARALSWERYLDGTGELLEALDADRSHLSFQERSLRLHNEALQNHLLLILALGGDWASAETESTLQP